MEIIGKFESVTKRECFEFYMQELLGGSAFFY